MFDPAGNQPTGVWVYDLTTFNLILGYNIEDLSAVSGKPGTVTTWGTNGSAFITSTAKVEVVRTEIDYGSLGEYTPVSPARVLDTRDGSGRGGVVAKLEPGQAIDVPVTGLVGVPSTGVDAVVLNVTVTAPTSAGFLTVWPTGGVRPGISNLNFTPGATVPNLAIVRVGSGGKVSLFNSAGSSDVLFDVAGFFATEGGPSGSRFFPLTPARIVDTRNETLAGLGPGGLKRFTLPRGGFGLPASGVTAVALNVTATKPSAAGFVTVYPDDVARPTASNLNFTKGVTVPNLVIVRVPASGIIDFYNDTGTTHVIADVVGYFADAPVGESGRLLSESPFRDYDSREDFSPFPDPGKIPAGFSLVFNYTDPPAAIVMNVTVTEPTAPSFLTVYPEPGDLPNASNLNFVAGQSVANLVIARPSPELGFYNDAGETHVIIDVFAIFT